MLLISAVCALVASTGFALGLSTRVGGDVGVLRVDDLGQLGSAIAAGVAAGWAAGRSTGGMRASWAAIDVGAGMWALGRVVWCYCELIAHRDAPFPSWADAGYLGFPVAAVVGLWLFPSTDDSAARRRWLLDGAIIVAALVTVSRATSLGAVTRAGGANAFAFAVAQAYPVGDILVLSVAILEVARLWANLRRLLLVSAAMAAMAAMGWPIHASPTSPRSAGIARAACPTSAG